MLPQSIVDPADLIDRELSWLDFNSRVLDLAEDPSVPLLERVRFLSIFASNLDDFFMIRVASVRLKVESGSTQPNVAGFTPSQLLDQIMKRAHELVERQTRCFRLVLVPELAKAGIHFTHWDDLTDVEKSHVKGIFDSTIFPVLTPLAVDPSHPFPYISGLSLSLAVIVRHPETKDEFFARVKVPNILPRFIPTQSSVRTRFIALEEVISAHLDELFPGMIIEDYYSFRLTRNEDLELEEEESENLLETMEQELLQRKFGPPVRLEVEIDIKPELLNRLVEELEITEREVVKYVGPLDLTGLNIIADLDRPELKYPAFRGVIPSRLGELDNADSEAFFAAIRSGEIMLHHPYESFSSSIVRFLETAATDPHVLAIKQTLYRTSGDSPIIEALIEAAAAGKQVLAVIEIRARFDELANVRWARKLEDAGVHVVYGLMGLKTHAKLSLVVRSEGNAVRRYCHVGTGNYNPKTARGYEDLGILSADHDLGDDLTRLFNQLSGFVADTTYSRLLVAPRSLRKSLLQKIEREIEHARAGRPAKIKFKLNSLLDEEFVNALYRASNAGVKIDLTVRGICAIKPNLTGKSENIRIRSYLGRFLEHSRIYYFANGGQPEYWIGSADLMHRNLDRRIETLIKVTSTDHQKHLQDLLDMYERPDIAHWYMTNSGEWFRNTEDSEGNVLNELHQLMIERIRNGKH